MRVNCYGISRDILKNDFIDIVNDEMLVDVAQLKNYILETYPAMHKVNGFAIAVNMVYASDDLPLDSNDEIAIIPPVSGG